MDLVEFCFAVLRDNWFADEQGTRLCHTDEWACWRWSATVIFSRMVLPCGPAQGLSLLKGSFSLRLC